MKDISIEERKRVAAELHAKGYNCAQSVLMAFEDKTRLSSAEACGIAAGLGAGVGGCGEICGAVSAMAIVAGKAQDAKAEDKKRIYGEVKSLCEEFKSRNDGRIVCRELKRPGAPRTCAALIDDCIEIAADYLAKFPSHKESASEAPTEAALYLLPTDISERAGREASIPEANIRIARGIRHFVVENLRTARRFLRRHDSVFPIDECEFTELNVRTPEADLSSMLAPISAGHAVALMSEAGCPAVADPGSELVALAQSRGIRVVPLPGPSSIIMSLMASGFNGQGFCFNGYLPIRDTELTARLRALESQCEHTGRTQIFIETPYRNDKTLDTIVRTLRADTLLCVARDIQGGEHERIITMPVKKWKEEKRELGKSPAIFLIHRATKG